MGKKLKRFFNITDEGNFSYYLTSKGEKVRKNLPMDEFK